MYRGRRTDKMGAHGFHEVDDSTPLDTRARLKFIVYSTSREEFFLSGNTRIDRGMKGFYIGGTSA